MIVAKDAIDDQLRRILSLRPDWDDANASAACEETVAKVYGYVATMRHVARRCLGVELGDPVLALCADGSIDAHWKQDAGEILLNIPNGSPLAEFYADAKGAEARGVIKELTQEKEYAAQEPALARHPQDGYHAPSSTPRLF